MARNNAIVISVGPFRIDVPQSLGYYGGIAAAVGLGVIEPPVGAFIAAIPVLRMLSNSAAPQPVRFVGEVLKGAAKPVGSDGEGTITLTDPEQAWRGVEDALGFGRTAARGSAQTA
ncbi:MAG: hypothetical protein ACTHJJ_03550 [Intrasporangium sp.]|uniref:hypothetical protein n=1 Tax=Intrasporangium sp. TaxID=1925024 RepID=UPI003F7CE874